MSTLTVSGGKIVLRNNKLGTESACCCNLPNCCESENVLLQITLEITGMQDGTYTGCGCLDGTYVADVYDLLWDGSPYSGFGSKVILKPDCTVTAPGPWWNPGNVELLGSVFLEWACNGTYGLADWGFREAPPVPPDYPATDQMRVTFIGGVACVGGSGNDPASGGGVDYKNPFFAGCDTSGVTATVTIQ